MKEHTFASALTKVGNSYSLRVPMHVVKHLDIEEGESVNVRLQKIESELTNEILQLWQKKARECPELKSWSDEKIILYSTLSYNEGMHIKEGIDKKYRHHIIEQSQGIDMNLNPEEMKTLEAQAKRAKEEYKKKIVKDFGDKIYKEFVYFRKVVDEKFRNKV